MSLRRRSLRTRERNVSGYMRGRGGGGIFGFAVLTVLGFAVFAPKNCGFSFFWRLLWFPVSLFISIWFSVFSKHTSGFSDLVINVVFGFFHLISGFSVAIMTSIMRPNSRDHTSQLQDPTAKEPLDAFMFKI